MKTLTVLGVVAFAVGLGVAETYWKELTWFMFLGLFLYSFRVKKPTTFEQLNVWVNWLMVMLIAAIICILVMGFYIIYSKGGLI